MDKNDIITAERLREVLSYDPATGEFIWLVRPSKRYMLGSKAGAFRRGYWGIAINGRAYLAHRLAWLHVTGEWPPEQIDHIDMDRSNNRYSNLRLATRSQNYMNRRAYSNNSLGIKGVCLSKGGKKYRANIYYRGKQICLGYYHTVKEAAEAHRLGAIKYHGEYARSG